MKELKTGTKGVAIIVLLILVVGFVIGYLVAPEERLVKSGDYIEGWHRGYDVANGASNNVIRLRCNEDGKCKEVRYESKEAPNTLSESEYEKALLGWLMLKYEIDNNSCDLTQ